MVFRLAFWKFIDSHYNLFFTKLNNRKFPESYVMHGCSNENYQILSEIYLTAS